MQELHKQCRSGPERRREYDVQSLFSAADSCDSHVSFIPNVYEEKGSSKTWNDPSCFFDLLTDELEMCTPPEGPSSLLVPAGHLGQDCWKYCLSHCTALLLPVHKPCPSVPFDPLVSQLCVLASSTIAETIVPGELVISHKFFS